MMSSQNAAFFRDELITLSPMLGTLLASLAIASILPHNFFLLASLLIAAFFAAGLLSFLPPVREAKARLIAADHIADGTP
jgi:hypothetical protein